MRIAESKLREIINSVMREGDESSDEKKDFKFYVLKGMGSGDLAEPIVKYSIIKSDSTKLSGEEGEKMYNSYVDHTPRSGWKISAVEELANVVGFDKSDAQDIFDELLTGKLASEANAWVSIRVLEGSKYETHDIAEIISLNQNNRRVNVWSSKKMLKPKYRKK